MKAARNRLIDLLEEHGESFLECKGCSLCSEIKKLRKYIDRDPAERFKHILAKGQDMTRSDIELLKENGVGKSELSKALGMSKYELESMLENFGFINHRGNDEMARLEMSPAEYVKLKFIEKRKNADIAAQKNVSEATIYNWLNKNADAIDSAKGNVIPLDTAKPVKVTEKPVESKPNRQDKTAEYAALIDELSDKVKQQEGMIEMLQAKVEEYENLNAACADVEEETANLRKEVDYLSEKRLEEKELYLDTLEQLKNKDYELENLKRATENNRTAMEGFVKENQSLRNMVKELVGLWA